MASNKSGYDAALTVSGAIAKVTDIAIRINHEPVVITDLSSDWVERTEGILDWSLSGRRNYASMAFLDLALAATTSVSVSVKNPTASSTVFSAAGFITDGGLNYPIGAANEDIEIVGTGATPVVKAD